MDSLVAQYSRPTHANEGPSAEEQLELAQAAPELSLKFAMPPIAQVRIMLHIPVIAICPC
jgi:20S proteasome subunit beta 5